MIHVVWPALAESYREELEAMHALRYRVFKERLDWDVSCNDGHERDPFDDCGPIYLLAAENGIRGVWRLLPTTGPYMLRDVFPALLEGQSPPHHPAIWETSRFAVESTPRAEEGLAAVASVTRMLFCGLVEFCLMWGITEVWQVYDVRIARLHRRIGCRPKWQSATHRVGNTLTVAGSFDINREVLGAMRAAGKINGSVLHPFFHARMAEAA